VIDQAAVFAARSSAALTNLKAATCKVCAHASMSFFFIESQITLTDHWLSAKSRCAQEKQYG
jgi:hypothetical protein